MRKLLFALLFSSIIPLAASAAFSPSASGLTTTGNEAFGEQSTTSLDLPTFIGNNIISPILGVLSLIFLVLMIYAGVLWMTGGGNEKQIEKAKAILVNSVIGIAIIALSYAITYAVILGITTGSVSSTTTTP